MSDWQKGGHATRVDSLLSVQFETCSKPADPVWLAGGH